MILKNTQEKIEFLIGCIFHIDRIFKHFSNKRKLRNITLDKQIKPELPDANILTEQKLPTSITLNGDLPAKNYDIGKLMVLTSLYNHVAAQITKEDIDLEVEFNKLKQDLHFTLLKNKLPGADVLMKKHRNHFLREGVLGYVFSFIWTPSSSSFLNKYEFFTKKGDWEDEFNFRYELATNCQFEVSLISQIEPIGMGLGYIIKTKSKKEASIIMDAIRKQLKEKKLDDNSIRYIDPQNMATKDEGSTIEIWGQAADVLENLIEKSNRKSF